MQRELSETVCWSGYKALKLPRLAVVGFHLLCSPSFINHVDQCHPRRSQRPGMGPDGRTKLDNRDAGPLDCGRGVLPAAPEHTAHCDGQGVHDLLLLLRRTQTDNVLSGPKQGSPARRAKIVWKTFRLPIGRGGCPNSVGTSLLVLGLQACLFLLWLLANRTVCLSPLLYGHNIAPHTEKALLLLPSVDPVNARPGRPE